MVISEMPDAKAASILAFVAAGGGGIEGSVTTQAFTTAEARDMLARGRQNRRPIQADGCVLTGERGPIIVALSGPSPRGRRAR